MVIYNLFFVNKEAFIEPIKNVVWSLQSSVFESLFDIDKNKYFK